MARGFNYAPGASAEVELAGSSGLSRAQIATLAMSRNAVVREVLAGRDDLALGHAVSLAHDRSAQVRAALAANTRVSTSVLEHLATDRSVPVLEALLRNPATPRDVLEQLAFHRRAEVRLAAARRVDGDVAAGPSAATATAGRASFTTRAPELRERAVGVATGDDVDSTTGLPVRPDAAVQPAARP
ncbi:MAG: hypothetical protein ACK4MD_02265 [Demequina sp.]